MTTQSKKDWCSQIEIPLWKHYGSKVYYKLECQIRANDYYFTGKQGLDHAVPKKIRCPVCNRLLRIKMRLSFGSGRAYPVIPAHKLRKFPRKTYRKDRRGTSIHVGKR